MEGQRTKSSLQSSECPRLCGLWTTSDTRLEDLSPDHHLGEIVRVPRNSMPPLKIMMIVLGYRVPTIKYSKLEVVMGVSNCCQSSYEWQLNCEGLIADYCTLQSLEQILPTFFSPEDVVLGPGNMAPPHLARQDLNKHWFNFFFFLIAQLLNLGRQTYVNNQIPRRVLIFSKLDSDWTWNLFRAQEK